jgi:hypothetical protein
MLWRAGFGCETAVNKELFLIKSVDKVLNCALVINEPVWAKEVS